jgi:hypothetical protein
MKTIKIQIGKFTEEYNVVMTKAPQPYDYAYVIGAIKDGEMRYVLIPVSKTEIQCGRYGSGNYSSNICENEGINKHIAEKLYNRLTMFL